MLTALRAYYDAQGIGAVAFACPHHGECSSLSPRFTPATESYVGPEYEAGTLPRLLFLSLDSRSGQRDAAKRTLEAVRRRILADDVDALPRGKHWYVTHELAWVLLRQFRPSLSIATVNPFFAHVNSAKCCLNNEQRRQADGKLFQNCRQFTVGELRILLPDILVTQGGEAKVVAEQFRVLEENGALSGCAECQARVIRIGPERRVLWLHTHHPSAYGLFWKQKKQCWPHYERAVAEFLGAIPRRLPEATTPRLRRPAEDPKP
jgi:hypothetical protein